LVSDRGLQEVGGSEGHLVFKSGFLGLLTVAVASNEPLALKKIFRIINRRNQLATRVLSGILSTRRQFVFQWSRQVKDLKKP
jgi:hypothetical protein